MPIRTIEGYVTIMGKARAGEWSLCSGAAAYWTKVHLGSG